MSSTHCVFFKLPDYAHMERHVILPFSNQTTTTLDPADHEQRSHGAE